MELVDDLWQKYLPDLRQKAGGNLTKPASDKYGFQQDKECNQSQENELGAAILREMEERDKQAKDAFEEEEAEEEEDSIESVTETNTSHKSRKKKLSNVLTCNVFCF